MVLKKKETQVKEWEIGSHLQGAKALKIVFEDSETSFFIKTNFSNPEQRPRIISRKWISKYDSGYKWNVEIIEKNGSSLRWERDLMNIALVEIDSYSGKIIRRRFFKQVYFGEYVRALSCEIYDRKRKLRESSEDSQDNRC